MDGGFRQELKRPSTAVAAGLALLSTIVGLIVSIYLYQKSIRTGELSYSVEQIQVYEADFNGGSQAQKAPISVLDKQGSLIKENIYAAKLKVWKSGTDEIKYSDVRSRPKILFDSNVRVLDYTEGYATSSNVDGFAVSETGELAWHHFDAQQGFVVTALYSSDRQRKIKIEAFIAGMQSPIDRIENRQHLDSMFSYILAGLMIFFAISFVAYAMFRKFKHKDSRPFSFTDNVLFNIFVFLLMVVNFASVWGGLDTLQRWMGLDSRPPF